ncbi:MAG: hypothetical protein NVSMB4_18010 [Acidimicrobiales bacterium]
MTGKGAYSAWSVWLSTDENIPYRPTLMGTLINLSALLALIFVGVLIAGCYS